MPEEVPVFIREAYCVWNAFRRLGFSADDLFFELDPKNIFITLRPNKNEVAERAFAVLVGPQNGMPRDMIYRLWRSFGEKLRDGGYDNATLDQWWEESQIRRLKVPFITQLQVKGLWSAAGPTPL